VREGHFALLIPSKWEFSKEYVQTIKRLLHHNLFFIVPFRSPLLCTEPLTSFFNDVFHRILSAVNGTDAPALLSVLFGI